MERQLIPFLGSVMAVPAHDTRDYTFAAHHKLDVIQVIKPVNQTEPGTLEPSLSALSDLIIQ